MSIGFLDTTDLMVYGHEGWLEPSTTHVHEGDTVQLYFKWGHNMVSDGLARMEGLSAFFVPPDGNQQELSITDQKKDCYIFSMVPKTAGIYHFICKYTGSYVIDREGNYHPGNLKDYPDAQHATLYTQFSHLSLQVGHQLPENGLPEMPELGLRLVPREWKRWRIGDEIVFNLQQGLNPLPHVKVNMAHAIDNGSEVRHKRLETDEHGNFSLKIEEAGRYLLIARHQSPEEEPDLYSDTHLTYTYFFSIKN